MSVLGAISRLPFSALVRISRRSWWEVQMVGGRTLGEWQTTGGLEMPLARLAGLSRWSELDHSKVVAARLWCPNGEIAEVRATGPYRVLQFKSGRRMAMPGAGESDTVVEAHVIGTLIDDVGGCECWEWTTRGLARFRDNVRQLHLRYGQGPLNLEALGLRL
jgi:hypothetical protein